ncbi:hypothetical protein ES703_118916 [subsurface metagenome]
MTTERRGTRRVAFARGFPVRIMGIDGTWSRTAVIDDISDTGAKLKIGESIEKLALKEFFLVLSSTGLAFRRCELAWVNGDRIGVTFLVVREGKKSGGRRGGQTAEIFGV